MPDFFDGKPADVHFALLRIQHRLTTSQISWYPPDTKEKGEKLGEFFQTSAAPPKTLERIPKVLDEIKSSHPDIKSWAILGVSFIMQRKFILFRANISQFCWGGKIVSLSSGKDSLFKVAGAAHPAMVDPEDASMVSIPFLMLPSKDEDKEAVAGFEKNLKVTKEVHTFDDQIHGWMAARGDLSDEKVKKAYEKGYQLVLNFFHEQM
jgi:hypothetical protein